MTDLDHLDYVERVQAALRTVLEELRKDLGLTRAQAATRIPGNTNERTLFAYERGERQLSFGRFLELAEAYRVSPVWLAREATRRAGKSAGCPSCGRQR